MDHTLIGLTIWETPAGSISMPTTRNLTIIRCGSQPTPTLCTVLDYCHAIHKVHPRVTGVTLLMTGGMRIIAVPIC